MSVSRLSIFHYKIFTLIALLATVFAWLPVATLAEEVTERDKFLEPDQTVDDEKSDKLKADKILAIGNAGARVRKLFTPPESWHFKMYEDLGSRFAPVVPEESMFFNIDEDDESIFCQLDIFSLSNAGFYPLAADGNLKPTEGGEGGAPPERHWAAKVSQYLYVTLEVDPDRILADTAFTGIEEKYSESEITISIEAVTQEFNSPSQDAADYEIRIVRSESVGGYTQPGDGTVTRDANDSSKWIYKAFKESKSEKHPKNVDIYLAPFHKNAAADAEPVGAEVKITVFPVFKITGYHTEGPGTTIKAATADDKQTGIDFVIWKYGVGGGYSMEYDNEEANGNVAWTALYPFADNETFIGDPAFGSENILASVIGHEAIHRGQGYYWSLTASEAEQEEPAYKWELDNKALTGIDEENNGYLQDTEDLYEEYSQ